MGLWMDASKFKWTKEAPYQDLPRAVMVFIDRPNPSQPYTDNDSTPFEFVTELQGRVDSRYNLLLRQRGSKEDYDFYLRMYHQYDVYRTVAPGNQGNE